MKINKDVRSLIKSFSYAINGLSKCIKNERNMRIHLVISTYIIMFSFFYDLSKVEYVLLLTIIAVVLTAELINTAIEIIVNMISPQYNNFAKLAKDIAAAGVFIAAVISVVIGFILFFDIEIINKIVIFFISNPLLLILLAFSIIFSLVFIFKKK